MTDLQNSNSLLNQSDSLERENEKLKIIVDKLMSRVEQATNDRAQGFVHFERAIALEGEVQNRTSKLEEAMDVLHATNARLAVAQKEAEEAQGNLATALETIQEGFAVFDADETLVMKNSRFSAMFRDVVGRIKHGVKFEEYLRICAQSRYIVRPNDMDVDAWVKRRIAFHASNSVNFTLELKDDFWLQVSEQRMPDGGTIVLQTDITDHARLEREERAKILDQQAKIVKATLDHIDQGVLIFDPQYKLVEWNDAAIKILKIPRRLATRGTRLARFERVFQPGSVFVPGSEPETIFDWASQLGTRPVLRREVEAMNGFKYEVFGQEMSDGSFVISFNDITSLRQAYEDLHVVNETLEQRVTERTEEMQAARDSAERANASKSRFVAAASHDLLQPVNAAKLFISSLEHTDLDDKQATIVSRISQSFQSVETILGALLDISKLDSGKVSLNKSDFEVGPIFERLQDEFAGVAAEKGIDLKIMPTSVRVHSDPVYFRRILQNLVSNALRYTESGRVLVGAKRREEGVDIHVFDTGIGIAPGEIEKVFKEFHRSDPTHTSESAMGLGLAIVERACSMLDHELDLQSQLGQGTQIRVSVPYAERKAHVTTGAVASDNAPLPVKNAIIMVIENDPAVREAMERMLEAWGAAPLIASSQDDAEAQIKALDLMPDLFLVDYHLDNDENGLDLIEYLRGKYGPLLAILLTADRTPEIERAAHSRGVFMRHKPVDIDDLRQLTGALLAPKMSGSAE